MKINPIQQSSTIYLAKINKQEKKDSSSVNILNSATNPMDNYGRSLVSFKSHEAEIIKKVATMPLEIKINHALSELSSKELLVVTDNIKKANNILKENIDKINIGIKNIKYIQDSSIDKMFLFAQSFNEDFIELINFNEQPIKGFNFLGMPFAIEQGEIGDMSKISMISLSATEVIPTAIGLDDEIDVLMTEYRSAYLQEATHNQEYLKAVKALNRKILMGETEKAKKKNKFAPTFANVGGQADAIKQLKKNLIYPIKHPEAYEKYYKNKGVILYGPPGTGKSLLAEAVGNEVNVSFFSVGGTDFNDKYVGGSEKLFDTQIQQAIDAQPSILFIDEVDSLARKRGGIDTYGDKLLNKVLDSMTRLQGEEVYLIAATNNIDLVDDAFLRSGRFGAQIKVGAPDLKGTEQIFDIHIKDKLDENLDKSKIIKSMHDLKMVGADIAIVIKEAHDNAFERLGIEKAMEDGTYSPAMLEYLELTQEDFDVAFKSYRERTNKSIRKPIGYVQK